MTRKWIIRRLVNITVLGAICFGVYLYVHGRASRQMLSESLKLTDELDLSPAERAALPDLIKQAHAKAFDKSLHLTADVGERFDGKTYMDELFGEIIRQANRQGLHELADKIAEIKPSVTFHVVDE
jgi:hypothetical protein